MKRVTIITIFLFILISFFLAAGTAYSFQNLPNRKKDAKQHRNGKLWTWVTNFGQFGSDQRHGAVYPGTDELRRRYINRGGLILGGIVDADGTGRHQPGEMDTLVSEGPSIWSVTDFREMLPHYPDSRSLIEERSTDPTSEFFHPDAVSDEDFIAVYTDTFVAATGLTNFKHKRALGLEIIEKSYSFSHVLLEDIVFFDIEVRNIGRNTIKQFYAGFFGDNDIVPSGFRGIPTNNGARDDATGFMKTSSTGQIVNTAWVAEPDGDNGILPSVVGVRMLYPTTVRLSYNWWMSDSDVRSSQDWGPRSPDIASGVVDPNDPYGSPEQDEDKYVVLVNGSIDPPQFDFEAKQFNQDIPAGEDPSDNSRFLISVGPLGTPTGVIFSTPRGGEPETLFKPGESVRFVYALLAGEGSEFESKALQLTDPKAFVDLGFNAFIAQTFFDLGYKFQELEDTVEREVIPERFRLYQNYPNPFNPTTKIDYELPEKYYVRLEIFNVLGKRVRALVDRIQDPGAYSVLWDGTDSAGRTLSNGVYIYRFTTNKFYTTKKMLLIK